MSSSIVALALRHLVSAFDSAASAAAGPAFEAKTSDSKHSFMSGAVYHLCHPYRATTSDELHAGVLMASTATRPTPRRYVNGREFYDLLSHAPSTNRAAPLRDMFRHGFPASGETRHLCTRTIRAVTAVVQVSSTKNDGVPYFISITPTIISRYVAYFRERHLL